MDGRRVVDGTRSLVRAAVGNHSPVRTCVGCRKRCAATELLRVVAAQGPPGESPLSVLPDPRRRSPGRGAWVHPEPACVELAGRRRAYTRALRVPGPVDPAPVVEYVSELGHPRQRTTAGDEQRMDKR